MVLEDRDVQKCYSSQETAGSFCHMPLRDIAMYLHIFKFYSSFDLDTKCVQKYVVGTC